MVQFASGFRADIPPIAKAVHENGGYLVVDIIQAAGWCDFNLSKLGIDFAAAQSAKWLLGPIGAGFIFVNRKVIDSVKPRHLGWWGVEDMSNFEYSERIPTKDATKFEVGSPAMVAYVGFNKSLNFLLSIPAATRERAALKNTRYLMDKLDELSIPYFEFEEKNQSPIVSCAPEKVEEMQKSLKDNRIHCSVRNGRLRVSPHFYNTFDDIDRLIDKLR
jgi:selenocysteine lyase/cysteine desulfurase